MADIGTYGQMPGVFPALQTTEAQIWWGRETDLLWDNIHYLLSTSTDAGNTPTSTLRAGLILGRVTSTQKFTQWDSAASDGSQNIWGVLVQDISMLDSAGVAEDKYAPILRRAPLIGGALFIKGVALVGHADEALARAQLRANGCIFDDSMGSVGSTAVSIPSALITGVTHAPAASSSGTRFLYNNVAPVAITLPPIAAGLVFEFLRVADEEIKVSSTELDNVIVINDLAADSVTYTTAGQQIGVLIRAEAIYNGATLVWLLTTPILPFGTGLTGGPAYSIAT